MSMCRPVYYLHSATDLPSSQNTNHMKANNRAKEDWDKLKTRSISRNVASAMQNQGNVLKPMIRQCLMNSTFFLSKWIWYCVCIYIYMIYVYIGEKTFKVTLSTFINCMDVGDKPWDVFAQVPVDLGLAETTQMAGDAYDTTDLRWEVIIERTTSGSRQPTWGLETAKKCMICVVLSGHRVISSLWY